MIGSDGTNVITNKKVGIRDDNIIIEILFPILAKSSGVTKLANKFPIAKADNNPPATVYPILASAIIYGKTAPITNTIIPLAKNA